jgi:hypothetical protein
MNFLSSSLQQIKLSDAGLLKYILQITKEFFWAFDGFKRESLILAQNERWRQA